MDALVLIMKWSSEHIRYNLIYMFTGFKFLFWKLVYIIVSNENKMQLKIFMSFTRTIVSLEKINVWLRHT